MMKKIKTQRGGGGLIFGGYRPPEPELIIVEALYLRIGLALQAWIGLCDPAVFLGFFLGLGHCLL
jgi:hypothetical protein